MENKDFVEFHDTHVHYLLHWEKQLPQKDVFVQPLANGNAVHYTWSEVAQQVRSMASYLQSLNLPEKSAIAIYGKNSAHWLMADLAIWMSGHISVPLYPTLNADGAAYVLNHSEAKLLFMENWMVKQIAGMR